jgi:hypothetical protein
LTTLSSSVSNFAFGFNLRRYSKGPDEAAEFAVGVFDIGDGLAAAAGTAAEGAAAGVAGMAAAAVAACTRAAAEGLDVVALRSVVACSPEQAAALASFSPHHIGVATAFGAGASTGGVTLAMAVRGRRAVSRWRNAVGADVTPDVAKVGLVHVDPKLTPS